MVRYSDSIATQAFGSWWSRQCSVGTTLGIGSLGSLTLRLRLLTQTNECKIIITAAPASAATVRN
jgi:hypothetical protein